MDAHNTFDKPATVKPAAFNVARVSERLDSGRGTGEIHHRAERDRQMNYAFRMKLKPGIVDEYKRRHDEIWPELVQVLREAGIYDYSIFLDEEDMHLFAVLKLARQQQARPAAQTSSHAALVGIHAGPDVHPARRAAQ